MAGSCLRPPCMDSGGPIDREAPRGGGPELPGQCSSCQLQSNSNHLQRNPLPCLRAEASVMVTSEKAAQPRRQCRVHHLSPGLLLPLYGSGKLHPKKHAHTAFLLRPGTSDPHSLNPMVFGRRVLSGPPGIWNGLGGRRQVFDKEGSFQLLVSEGTCQALYACQKLSGAGGEKAVQFTTPILALWVALVLLASLP